MNTDTIVYRMWDETDIASLSRQIATSYRTAYAGLMDAGYLSSLDDAHWIPILKGAMEAGDCCILAELGGQVLGSAVFGKTRMEAYPGYAELHAIYLLPDCIGRGIGHALYGKAERTMADQGYAGCVLEVLAENERAKRFYAGHGFEMVSAFLVDENNMALHCEVMRKAFPR